MSPTAAHGADRTADARAYLAQEDVAGYLFRMARIALYRDPEAPQAAELSRAYASALQSGMDKAACATALAAWAESVTAPGYPKADLLKDLARDARVEYKRIYDKKPESAFQSKVALEEGASVINGSHAVTVAFVAGGGLVLKTVPGGCMHMAEREAAAYNLLRSYKDHDLFTPRFHGMCRAEDGFRILLERAERVNAEAFIASAPSTKERVTMALHLAEAVSFVNRFGVHHRDIALRNLVRLRGRWVLIDFGLALVPGLVSTEGPSELQNLRSGALPELAPESIECGEFNKRTEVYMLGCAILHIFRGARNTGKGEVPEQAITALRDACPHCGQVIANLVADCVDPMPRKRPELRQVVEELKALEDLLLALERVERIASKRQRR